MIFLKVPFAEKDQAKALGARWNGERKMWYVPEGTAAAPFERWMPAVPITAEAAAGAGAGKKPGRVDSAAGKPVTGKLYAEADHACDPFVDCALCQPLLLASGWTEAHERLHQMDTKGA